MGRKPTKREQQVLALLTQGYSHQAIAAELRLELISVATYVKRLKRYYDVADVRLSPVTALVAIVQGQNLVSELDAFVELADQDVLNVWQVKREGNPRRALAMADKLAEALRQRRATLLTINALPEALAAAYQTRLRELLVETLVQLADCQRHVFRSQGIERGGIAVSNELRQLGRDSQDPRIGSLAALVRGHAYYLTGRYALAGRQLVPAIELLGDVDYQIEGLRSLALSQANLGETTRFQTTTAKLESVIAAGRWTKEEMVYQAYEGIGRGYSALRSDRCFLSFTQGMGVYAQLVQAGREPLPLPRIQFARSQLKALLAFKSADYRSTGDKVGRAGLGLSQEYRYRRFSAEIESMLQDLLN